MKIPSWWLHIFLLFSYFFWSKIKRIISQHLFVFSCLCKYSPSRVSSEGTDVSKTWAKHDMGQRNVKCKGRVIQHTLQNSNGKHSITLKYFIGFKYSMGTPLFQCATSKTVIVRNKWSIQFQILEITLRRMLFKVYQLRFNQLSLPGTVSQRSCRHISPAALHEICTRSNRFERSEAKISSQIL